jgi:uncharacterized protein involved in exopolysaccharide biosynthesis
MTDTASFDFVHVGEYLALFRREKWRGLAVGGAILAAAVAAATLWPPTYRSTATILIEESDIPADLVASTVSAFASERIQAIQQRVITTANLVAIINKFNLYAEERQSTQIGLIADQMRRNIDLTIVSADAGITKGGRDTRAAIAFSLSFDGEEPQTTQLATSEMADLFLSESQRDRDAKALGTTSFLEAESNRLQGDVQSLESKLEVFRTANTGYLPEDRPVNSQLLDRTDSQLLDLSRQIQTLREREGIIRAQLARTPSQLQYSTGQGAPLSPAQQLAMLQSKRTELSARYGTKHPDVMALDRQIEAFKASTGAGVDSAALRQQVQTLQSELEAARQKYGAKHPDALRLERELKSAQDQLAAMPVQAVAPEPASNPDYLQLQVELASVNGEIAATIAEQRSTEDKKAKIEERVFRGPSVERDYIALKRDYDAAVSKYVEVRSKQAEAELTKNLETRRMGETLTLIEPPTEPLAPIKPNRRAILAIGMLAAVVGAIVTTILHDAADGRIHGGRQLAALCGQSPFAVVPNIQTDLDRRRGRQAVMLQLALGVLVCAAMLFYVHTFVMPLDVLWTEFAGRFGLLPTASVSSAGS